MFESISEMLVWMMLLIYFSTLAYIRGWRSDFLERINNPSKHDWFTRYMRWLHQDYFLIAVIFIVVFLLLAGKR
ncbi:hypothetical protein CWM47_14380 [Spirosoma pollinicola]|uniref:Uncharacterized protein n=1 Tax=Spirosoma pollinicola TaxID=2057025 RepID=A0A2K8YZB4_9BACT|nr:hypothetical protein CWM47_14380 [Spirosoma pollinicola]